MATILLSSDAEHKLNELLAREKPGRCVRLREYTVGYG